LPSAISGITSGDLAVIMFYLDSPKSLHEAAK
jgi:hypothetical protein